LLQVLKPGCCHMVRQLLLIRKKKKYDLPMLH